MFDLYVKSTKKVPLTVKESVKLELLGQFAPPELIP